MIEDYFSEEAINQRVNQRMIRLQRLFIHVIMVLVAIFAGVFLMVSNAVTAEVFLLFIGVSTVSMVAHSMRFRLTEMREGLTQQEFEAARAADGKSKHDEMTLSDDGELVPVNRVDDDAPFYDRDDAQQARQ